MSGIDPLLAPLQGAERRDVGGVKLEVVRAGAARVKRMIYPVGFRWSTDMKPLVHTDQCMHAHIGFLARGSIHIGFPDGCVREALRAGRHRGRAGARWLGRRQRAGDRHRVRLRGR